MSGWLMLMAALLLAPATEPTDLVPHAFLKSHAWQLALPTDSFGPSGVLSAAHQAHALGVHHLEVMVGQAIDDEPASGRVDRGLSNDALGTLRQRIRSAGLDVVSVRLDHSTDPAAVDDTVRIASGLGAKILVLNTIGPYTLAAAREANLKIAMADEGWSYVADQKSERIIFPLGTASGQLYPVGLSVRMSADREKDLVVARRMVGTHWTGIVTVQPEQKTAAGTIAALDAFADAVRELPTTRP